MLGDRLHPSSLRAASVPKTNLRRFFTRIVPAGSCALIVASVLTAGCVLDAGGPGDARANEQNGQQAAGNVSGPLNTQPGFDQILADVSDVHAALDQFWSQELADTFGVEYQPIDDLSYYDGAKPDRTSTVCPEESNNAFYCSSTNVVAFDGRWFLEMNKTIGDSWNVYVLAHEWGHVIQAELGDAPSGVGAELQADCYAGAFLSGATKAGSFTWETGDADEILKTFIELGDDLPWTDPAAHGNAHDRAEAYFIGFENDAAACYSLGSEQGGGDQDTTENTLANHLPVNIDVSNDCQVADVEESSSASESALCSVGGDLLVQYYLFSDTESMNAEYDSLLQDPSVSAIASGACRDVGDWSTDNGATGRASCLESADIGAVLIWTDESVNILALVASASGNGSYDSLAEFWGSSDSSYQ